VRSREWQAKVLDLKSRVRCGGCGAGRRAVVSVKGGRQSGSAKRDEMEPPVRVLRAADRVSYPNTAEANQPTASQSAAHSPNDRNNTAVIDTRSDQ
jgi:hypothetical protein